MTTLIVRVFTALQAYRPIWQAMQDFTASRSADTPDELWLLEHQPVYTQGLAGKPEHLLRPGAIPVIQSDRGGQVTWHGPGQLMVYCLLDTRRAGLGARALVACLEQVLVEVLAAFGVVAYARVDAPGVYVARDDGQEAKIAAIGLRMRRQGCYHGASLNLGCDLAPFAGINPCGYAGMPVTRLADLLPALPARPVVEQRLVDAFATALRYSDVQLQRYDTSVPP